MPTLINGQTFLERLNKKVKEKVNLDIPNTQTIVGLFAKTDKSNYQNVSVSAQDEIRYYKIANNFFLDIANIKKDYPKGYEPRWEMIRNFSGVPFTKVNYLQNKLTGSGTGYYALGEVNGKAYIYFSGFLSCTCAAPLVKEGEKVVINNKPQTFVLTDFKQVTKDGKITSESCKSMTGSYYDTNGWRLKISLRIDDKQTIVALPVISSLTAQQSYIKRNGNDISTTWTGQEVSLPNLMSPEMAVTDLRYKEQAKKEAEIRAKIQEMEAKAASAAFEKEIKNSYQDLVKIQNTYPVSNLKYLKVESGYYTTPSRREIRYDDVCSFTAEGVPMGVRSWYEEVPGRSEEYSGLKNTSDKAIILRGVTKKVSPKGTIYYVDASFRLDPGEMTNYLLTIEDSYNKDAAEVESTHYFKNKLVLK